MSSSFMPIIDPFPSLLFRRARRAPRPRHWAPACLALAAFSLLFGEAKAELATFAGPGKLWSTSVTLRTSDAKLQNLYDSAEAIVKAHVLPLAPGFDILSEGGGYTSPGHLGIWLENGPLCGEWYAKRNIAAALNNQLIFLRCQRKDGRLPGMVKSMGMALAADLNLPDHCPPGIDMNFSADLVPDYRYLQGAFFAENAFRMYFWINQDKAYLQDLARTLESFDRYLWRVRDSNHDGVLESWCAWDTGEDTGIRYLGATNAWPFEYPPNAKGAWVWSTTFERMAEPEQMMLKDPATFDKAAYDRLFKDKKLYSENPCPVQSMDVMGFSYDARHTLARASRILGDGREAYWQAQADEVKQRLEASLWRPEKHAFYDRDKDGRFMETLLHNNLRVMHFGACRQELADEFIRYHLLNPAEFWTPLPLPSIAANDPLFRNVRGNNWSGQPADLTFQRVIRALENYGHFAELTLIGHKLLDDLAGHTAFYQQFDPFSGEQNGPVEKGDRVPITLAALEYMSRMYGIQLDLPNDRIWWSGLSPGAANLSYAQQWGDNTAVIANANGRFEGTLNGRKLFSCTAGSRVVTDLAGNVVAVVGIDSMAHEVQLQAGALTDTFALKPNQLFAVAPGGRMALQKSIPFDFPYRPPQPGQ